MSQSEQDKRVDYIELSVRDIAAAKRFYGAVFGWSFEDYGPAYTSFNDGRLSGGFALVDEHATGGPLVVIYAADLEAVRAGILAAEGTIVRDIFEFPGGRRFHFSDPSGNELAVWSDRPAQP